MRAVLEGLDRSGPRTVPAMARARLVTRQHIQTILNELLERKLVETQERERRALRRYKVEVSEKDLARTAESLREIRSMFNSRERGRRSMLRAGLGTWISKPAIVP